MSRKVRQIVRAAAIGLVLFVSGAASAVPMDVYMRDGFGMGFEAPAIPADLIALAGSLPRPDTMFVDPDQSRIVTSTQSEVLLEMPAIPSRATPSRLEAVFGFEAVDQDYEDLWIVIRGHATDTDPTGNFYATTNFGLNIDATANLIAFLPDPINFPDVYHLAVFLGDLAVGERADVLIEYAIAQDLFIAGQGPSGEDQFVGPQLLVGYMELSAVPEPGGVLWVVSLGFLAVVSARRRAS